MIKRIISFFKFEEFLKNQPYFELDLNREYSNDELINILQNEYLTLSMGNSIMLILIRRINDKIKDKI